MYRTRARSQLIQQRNLEFNLLNDGHPGRAGLLINKGALLPHAPSCNIWVGPASFPSLSYINFGKIVLRSGKFQTLFWRLLDHYFSLGPFEYLWLFLKKINSYFSVWINRTKKKRRNEEQRREAVEGQQWRRAAKEESGGGEIRRVEGNRRLHHTVSIHDFNINTSFWLLRFGHALAFAAKITCYLKAQAQDHYHFTWAIWIFVIIWKIYIKTQFLFFNLG